MMKKLLIPLLMLAAFAFAAGAEEFYFDNSLSVNGFPVSSQDLGAGKGGMFPVYSAPFTSAWRGAQGKAQVSTKGDIWLIAVSPDREWSLVRYKVSRTAGRVGWIHTAGMKQVWAEDADYDLIFMPECVLLRAVRDVALTDDPLGEKRVIRTLRAGDTVIGLTGVLKGNDLSLAYVETQVRGAPAYLFGDRAAFEPVPVTRFEDGVLTVEEGVTHLGSLYRYVFDDEGTVTGVDGPELRPRMIRCPYLDAWIDENGDMAREVSLPSTLEFIGWDGLGSWYLNELRLPEGLRTVKKDAFIGGTIGEIIVPASLSDGEGLIGSNNEYFTVGRYTVSEGNPAYRDLDGILFDTKGTLLSYPAGRKDTHFDVPAGTAAIGDGAFASSSMEIPLETISLPLGLKSIGRKAFSGCGRLMSLTVPLTVKTIDPTAFYNCVSLERLSLPEGFTALKNDGQDFWVRFNDFTHYNGDNGQTGMNGDPGEGHAFFSGYLRGKDGSGVVRIYRGAEDEDPSWITDDGLMADFRGTDEKTGRLVINPWTIRDLPDTLSGSDALYAEPEDLVPTAGPCLFSYASVTPGPGILDAVTGETLPFDRVRDSGYYWGSLMNVYLGEGDDWRAACVFIGDSALTLRRERTGDDRALGILVSKSPRAAVFLTDAEGNAAAEVFSGEQAELLEEKDGRCLIRCAFGTHWVDRDCLRIVDQAEPE